MALVTRMQRIIVNLEDDQLAGLDKFILERRFGTDRSKLLRELINDFLKEEGYVSA